MDEHQTDIKVDLNYVKHFQKHVADTSSYLNARDNGGCLWPSYFPPSGFWTSEDKDRFFHALTIHSRYRPDLIASEIPGKTTVDVCVYLELLAEGSAKEPKTWKRSDFPAAYEVSDKLAEFEETQARASAAMEPTWESESREERRTSALRAERRAFRRKLVRQESRDVGQRERYDEKLKASRAKQEAKWAKEDYLEELGPTHLLVMDNILREAEEASTTLVGCGPETSSQQKVVSAFEHAPESSRLAVPSACIDPGFINSGLLSHEQSHPHALNDASLQASVREEPPTNAGDVDGRIGENDFANAQYAPEEVLANLSPRSRVRYQKRLYMRRKRATESGKEVDTTLRRLKPGRQTNKNLLREQVRRRARSKAAKSQAQTTMDVNMTLFTIQPQDEDEKQEYIDVFEGKEETEISFDAMPNEECSDPEELASLRAKLGGPTRRYKIKKELSDMGIDFQTLESSGLDLFHLSKFGALMGLQACICNQGEGGSCQCLSGQLINLFHAEVAHFVIDVMHRAIAICEQGARIAWTKAWTTGEKEVTASDVHRALETLGATASKRQHFASWLEAMESLVETSGQSEESLDRDVDAVSGDDVSASGSEFVSESNEDDIVAGDHSNLKDIGFHEPAISLFRDIYAAFVWHPSLALPDPDSAVSLRASRLAEEDSEIILENLDDSKLHNELVEEERADEADLARAEDAEHEFWKEMRSHKATYEFEAPHRSDGPEEDNNDAATTAASRKRPGRSFRYKTAKRVKSSVFVEDSD